MIVRQTLRIAAGIVAIAVVLKYPEKVSALVVDGFHALVSIAERIGSAL